ncbi:MAG TPA: polyketide cyclase, partial [Cytophagaceae bacterium]
MKINSLLQDKSFRISILLTLIFLGTGIVFLFLGWATFSIVLFGLLPVVLGLAIGALPNRKWARIGAVIATLFFLVGLLTAGLAGFICIIYSIPIILPFVFLGSVITHLIDRYKKIKTERIHILLLPLIPFLIIAPAETLILQDSKLFIEVKTEKIYNYTTEQVYDGIKSVDTVDTEKPFLMHFDLPIPTKCILDKEEVGGIRTCYFDGGNLSRREYGGGKIRERITELERG